MIAEAFIICWNEIETIHLTISHYQKFCDKITIFDNFSDDGTAEKCRELGCEVQYFGIKGVLDDKEYLKVKNHCYKQSKAKWVIVCDSDEILWHPDIKRILEESEGTIFNTIGWDVFSNDMPKNDFLEIQTGFYYENGCKSVIFSPKIDIRFVFGCHVSNPYGLIRKCDETLTLFHYRNIGGYERLSERHKIYRERLSSNNKRWKLGIHYTYPEEQRKKEWYDSYDKAHLYDYKSVGVLPVG